MSRMADEDTRKKEEKIAAEEATEMREDSTAFEFAQAFKEAQARAFQAWWESTPGREFVHTNPKINKAAVRTLFQAGYGYLWDELPNEDEGEESDEYTEPVLQPGESGAISILHPPDTEFSADEEDALIDAHNGP